MVQRHQQVSCLPDPLPVKFFKYIMLNTKVIMYGARGEKVDRQVPGTIEPSQDSLTTYALRSICPPISLMRLSKSKNVNGLM